MFESPDPCELGPDSVRIHMLLIWSWWFPDFSWNMFSYGHHIILHGSHMILYGFHMICIWLSYDFIWVSYDFVWCSYDSMWFWYDVCYNYNCNYYCYYHHYYHYFGNWTSCFTFPVFCFLVFTISRLLTIGRKFQLPPHFSDVPFFILTFSAFFWIINVWPEIPTTTERLSFINKCTSFYKTCCQH